MYRLFNLGKTILAPLACSYFQSAATFSSIQNGPRNIPLGRLVLSYANVLFHDCQVCALTCSIIDWRAIHQVSIYFFTDTTLEQFAVYGLMISGAMVLDFVGKKGGGHGHGVQPKTQNMPEEMQKDARRRNKRR
jgi:hypothetical protein